MIRRSVRLQASMLFTVGAIGVAGWLAGSGLASAQAFPRLAARHSGAGSYEIRGGGGTWELNDARVVLGEGGRATIELWGRKIQLSMSGKISSYNGREHVNIVLDTFDGKPTTAAGWLELDRRGGFSRIEFDGQTPVRLGVSFQSKGANVEPAPPPPPTTSPAPPPGSTPAGLTEEYAINRRGADYRDFPADDLRTCQNACKNDTRCRAYAYNLNRRICYLKSQVPEANLDREVTSGVKQGTSTGTGGGTGTGGSGGGNQGQLTEERGFDRRGNDYADFRAQDLRDCQDSCRRDERCRAYSFDVGERVCWLKDRVNSQQHNRDMVTGYKE